MTVNLDQPEWNQVLAILSQAPWNVANPLLLKIGEQLRQQTPPEARPDGTGKPADGQEGSWRPQ